MSGSRAYTVNVKTSPFILLCRAASQRLSAAGSAVAWLLQRGAPVAALLPEEPGAEPDGAGLGE